MELKPNMTLHEIVQYHYELQYPNHGLTPEELDAEIKERLAADDLSLLQIGIRRVFANHAEAEAWDLAEPQRVFDAAMEYFWLLYCYETGVDTETAYPSILRAAVEACHEKDFDAPQEAYEWLAQFDANPTQEPPKRKLCFARKHLRGVEFQIWDLARAYWESSGECWLSARTVANQCAIAPNTATKYIRLLRVRGWLELISEAKPGAGHTAKEQSARYRPVKHDEWVKAQGDKECL
jgi:hypothetical protein